MFQLEDCIAFLTSKTAKHLSQAFDKRLKSEGNISRSLWVALYYIDRYGALTQAELADKIAIKEPSLVGLLSSLEAEGFITKSQSTHDKRTKVITLSDKGRSLLERTESTANKFKEDAIRGLSDEELEIYNRVLQKMHENID